MSEKKTFAELVGERLYKAIYEKLDSSAKAELYSYEVDYDYGNPTHAQTSEQYEEAVEKIVSGAVKCMLDNYVVQIESELIEEKEALARMCGSNFVIPKNLGGCGIEAPQLGHFVIIL